MTMITGARNIERFRLATVRRAILIEADGGRVRAGTKVTTMWARHLGLKDRAKPAEVLAAIDGMIAELDR
jgi:hypothetical protein